MIAAGEIGAVHYLQGAYLQDWLLKPTDYSWRLEADQGGASSAFADIGSHWCDLAEHLVGDTIVDVLAFLMTAGQVRVAAHRVIEQRRILLEDLVGTLAMPDPELVLMLLPPPEGAR